MFDLDKRWQLHPQAALRPEPFGAMLYHFGTRRLSFLKNRVMVEVVRSLPDHMSARAALCAAGVEDVEAYVKALEVLANSQMLEQTS
ncbi:mycofactocin biosynthesis chaperone MftB [Mycolicibacterium sp. jd]|uniref:Mycofactocin biosynthesis chaperone MftB n=1 Tax=Mycolicibacterium austroafricanum TaxID=39687 RepID=A0ABT8H960_MYCAO|nr:MULTISPECIES: mycofactocin biosynthesis chaperone MftB [Mycolicibacterium]MDN4517298.1 mycofactocin biosynthesis chaperone MftB [Mycolicibacterium austroafricanum]UJL30664.1 mycofactocin biosynthesis chaperone MftB [Mycolicibacterium vanbaalenii]WND56231.1 mycofactocin biosynthesis chaperone MftB [Mycolicibacterium vanbaalenii]